MRQDEGKGVDGNSNDDGNKDNKVDVDYHGNYVTKESGNYDNDVDDVDVNDGNYANDIGVDADNDDDVYDDDGDFKSFLPALNKVRRFVGVSF